MRKKRTPAAKKTSTRKKNTPYTSLLLSRRIIVIGGTLGVLAIALFTSRQRVLHTVQGASIVQGLYMEAMIPLPQIPGAAGYNIYYTQNSNAVFTDAVRGISPKYTSYTIGYLKKGTEYKYKVAVYDATGKEFWFSPMSIMTNLQGM